MRSRNFPLQFFGRAARPRSAALSPTTPGCFLRIFYICFWLFFRRFIPKMRTGPSYLVTTSFLLSAGGLLLFLSISSPKIRLVSCGRLRLETLFPFVFFKGLCTPLPSPPTFFLTAEIFHPLSGPLDALFFTKRAYMFHIQFPLYPLPYFPCEVKKMLGFRLLLFSRGVSPLHPPTRA